MAFKYRPISSKLRLQAASTSIRQAECVEHFRLRLMTPCTVQFPENPSLVVAKGLAFGRVRKSSAHEFFRRHLSDSDDASVAGGPRSCRLLPSLRCVYEPEHAPTISEPCDRPSNFVEECRVRSVRPLRARSEALARRPPGLRFVVTSPMLLYVYRQSNRTRQMPEMRGKRIMTNVYLDPPALADLKRLSTHTRIPMAAYLREALEDLLKKHAKELRRTGR